MYGGWFPGDDATDYCKILSPLEAQLQLLNQELGQSIQSLIASRTTLGWRSNGGTDNTTTRNIVATKTLQGLDIRWGCERTV